MSWTLSLAKIPGGGWESEMCDCRNQTLPLGFVSAAACQPQETAPKCVIAGSANRSAVMWKSTIFPGGLVLISAAGAWLCDCHSLTEEMGFHCVLPLKCTHGGWKVWALPILSSCCHALLSSQLIAQAFINYLLIYLLTRVFNCEQLH